MVRYSVIIAVCILGALVGCKQNEKEPFLEQPQEITLEGKILNFNEPNGEIEAIVSDIGFGSKSFVESLDKEYTFTFHYESYAPNEILLKTALDSFFIIAHPGDHIYFEYDMSKHTYGLEDAVHFSGDRAGDNNDIIKFQDMARAKPINDEKIRGAMVTLVPEAFTSFLAIGLMDKTGLYYQYSAQEGLDEELKGWTYHYIKRPLYQYMAMFETEHATKNKLEEDWKVPTDFYDYQKEFFSLKKEHVVSSYHLNLAIEEISKGYLSSRLAKEETPSQDDNEKVLQGIIKYIENPLLKQLMLTYQLNKRFLEKEDYQSFKKHEDLVLTHITEPYLLHPLQEKYNAIAKKSE